MTVWMQNVGKTSLHLNNQKSESERGQNTAISTQTAISFMRMLSTILPGVLNMGCCPWDVSTCICLQSLLFDNYENESFLTCPVLSDSLFVTLTFSKVITWKKIKSYQNIKSFQIRSYDVVSLRTFNFRRKILADDDIVKYVQLCKKLQMPG